MGPADFNPTPAQTDALIHHLCDPDHSLSSVANLHKTSLEALSLFIARPDIQARLLTLASAAASKARLDAALCLPGAVRTLRIDLSEYLEEATSSPVNPGSTESLEQRRRARETARRGISLLLRIARFDPTKPIRAPRPAALLRPATARPASTGPSASDELLDRAIEIFRSSVQPSPAATPPAAAPTAAAPADPRSTPLDRPLPANQATGQLLESRVGCDPQLRSDPPDEPHDPEPAPPSPPALEHIGAHPPITRPILVPSG